MTSADTISKVCSLLEGHGQSVARELLSEAWPFVPYVNSGRRLTPRQLVLLWMRDGFVDRYDGRRLVFPGVLRLLSELLPDAFPYHPNGRYDRCHEVHWTLYPSHDHVIPISRGGADHEHNLVTTSMRNNQIKAQWTLEELGWDLQPKGALQDWDGLMSWFVNYCDNHSDTKSTPVADWLKLARFARSNG